MMPEKRNTRSQKLLITGITGYIGFQTLIIALERGYRVRGVVRSQKNIAELESKSAVISSSHSHGHLEFAIVPDFLQENALSNALDGITAIVHLASPLAMQTENYEADIVEPGVLMVTSLLEAATKVSTVRRVVVTSSCVTLVPFEWNMNPDSERLYTAADINNNLSGPFQSSMEAYWATKALARIAARKYIRETKPQFDYVNLLPSVVIGADTRIPVGAGAALLLQGTRAAVMAPVLDSSFNSAFPYVGVPVHVADVARAHVDAVDMGLIPGNSEYILSSDGPDGVTWDSDIGNIARKHFAVEVKNGILPMAGSLPSIKFRLDILPTEKTFGWTFTSFEETMKDLISQYLVLKDAGDPARSRQ